MLRVVIDCNVLVSAFRSRLGASFVLLEQVRAGVVRALATPALFLEYEAVLKRGEQLLACGLTLDDVDLALDGLASVVEPVEAHLRWRPQLPDPDDEMVLEAALNGRADALVTYNSAHFRDGAARFALRLASPAAILREVLPP